MHVLNFIEKIEKFMLGQTKEISRVVLNREDFGSRMGSKQTFFKFENFNTPIVKCFVDFFWDCHPLFLVM